MKNAYGVEPTRFMKRKENDCAIICKSNFGPIFGADIFMPLISNFRICTICNDGTHSYECHPEYKSSLFVNTAGSDEDNDFSVLDYEVYCIDIYKDYIYGICKHPDIIWKCIETDDIPDDSLQQFDDDTELLNDLNVIHCKDINIRLKISNYYLKNPSESLTNTQIVNQQYDGKLREWCGDYEWKLLYRASEHEYTAKSFHEYCDNVRGPTLIVIKSSGGWIFGGYTTQSWKVVHPNEMGCIFIAIIQ